MTRAMLFTLFILMGFVGLTTYGQLPWEPFGKLMLTTGIIGGLGFLAMAGTWRTWE